MLKIHHARRARSARVIWLCEELSIPYELATFEFKREILQSPEYKALHPLGQVPVVQDGDITLFESGAIVEYLLEKHGEGRLSPAVGSPERALYLQWFHYGEASVARHLSDIVRHRFALPEAQRNAVFLEEARGRFRETLAVVDQSLTGRTFMLGDAFSAADIMVAYGIVMAKITKELPAELENVARYLGQLAERPAYAKAWA
jgi:glutathione S-transferase